MPTFWGISVGPGDPNWLTVQSLDILRSTSLIACPQNRHGQPGLAYTIAQRYLQPEQRILPLYLPFVQDPGCLEQAWQAAGEELSQYLRQDHDVAFLSEGDVSFYSTFTYLARQLQQTMPDLNIRALPGVCSPLAAVARLGTPLAIGDDKVAILPALYAVTDLPRILTWANSIVLMKVAPVFGTVWQQLEEANLLPYAALVEAVGQEQEKIWPSLEGLSAYRPPYFSLVIIRPPR